MTQEERQLLIKDLCARFPYGVICRLSVKEADVSITDNLEIGGLVHFIYGTMNVEPYLRPMSSMTEEEIDRMWEIYESGPAAESSVAVAEYLYERHLDCHYLIEKGLALEAPEGMYKIE